VAAGAPELAAGVRSNLTDRERLLDELRPGSFAIAMLVLLESLSPEQRAVLLLHEVFDYSYPEVAAILGKSEDNVRQLATRARRHLTQRRPRFQTTRGSTTSWHDGSFRPPSTATSLGWRRCSPTTWR
jgi:DNA-directed RNA polymerase specialized sigma24 family protein